MFAPDYKELTVKTIIKRVGDKEDVRYIPDLPVQPGLCLVYCMGRNFYAYPLPPETENQEAICHVIYQAKDSEAMDKFAGKLGLGNEVCKLKAYTDIVKTTVGEQKIAQEKEKLIQEATAKGEVVKPSELEAVKYDIKDFPDAEDGAPIWIFQTKEYADK